MATSLQPIRPSSLRVEFPCDLTSARAAASSLRAFLADQSIPQKDLFACELCLAEGCNNAVEYAKDRQHSVIAEAICTSTEIELRVSDHTAGFVWPSKKNRAPPPGERGRGIFIIRSMMDEAQYLRGSSENLLIMRKARVQRQMEEFQPAQNSEALKRDLADCKRTAAAMARELCFRSETLSTVFRCCAELGRTADVEGFEERLLGDLLHLTAADWYVLRIISSQDGQLHVAAASEPALRLDPLPFPAFASIEATVAATRTSARFDARSCTSPDPLQAAGTEAFGLVYPLCFGGTLVGTVSIGRSKDGPAFGELHDMVVRTFAEFLAIQTVNLHRREEEVCNLIVARELEIAREIQRSLLPLALPQIQGFGLAASWESAREVGGDFYDAMVIGENKLLLVVADVMGKGVPAALFATIIRGLLRGLATRRTSPGQLLGRLNKLLYPELSAVDMFITAQVAIIDLATRVVTAASAGHCPILLVPGDGTPVTALPTKGVPLGVLQDATYRQHTLTLGRPATLLLHTDGLTEARNGAGEMFGQRRLMEWLRSSCDHSNAAIDLRDRLKAELNQFRGNVPMHDDQAFLLLAEETPPGQSENSAWWRAAAVAESTLPASA